MSDFLELYESLADRLRQELRDVPEVAGIVSVEHGRCLAVLRWVTHNGGFHNVRHYQSGRSRKDRGWTVNSWDGKAMVGIGCRGELSSFDGAAMTRLVVEAHRHACRVSVSPLSMGTMRVLVHTRDHDASSSFERHPNLEQLSALCGVAL